jgi:hypothetical protein
LSAFETGKTPLRIHSDFIVSTAVEPLPIPVQQHKSIGQRVKDAERRFVLFCMDVFERWLWEYYFPLLEMLYVYTGVTLTSIFNIHLTVRSYLLYLRLTMKS